MSSKQRFVLLDNETIDNIANEYIDKLKSVNLDIEYLTTTLANLGCNLHTSLEERNKIQNILLKLEAEKE